jgi:superfamily I DNA/RNA helicase
LLNAEGWVEWADAVREARLFIAKQNVTLPYRAVLCDEVQDMSGSELLLLRAIAPEAPNSLFLVGDGHQRIYGQPVKLSTFGIEIRGRSRRLKLNYRTTKQIRDHAMSMLGGCEVDDLDGGIDTLQGYQSLRFGPPPQVLQCKTENEEVEVILDQVRKWLTSGVPSQSICIAARTKAQITERYQLIMEAAGIATARVQTDPESEQKRPGIRLATMHRMKGLEFSRVILVGVQDGIVPLRTDREVDEIAAGWNDTKERSLLYVAATRARDELVITGFGRPCPFLAFAR